MYEVIDQFGEVHSTGTYMECMAFINEPSQAKHEFTTDNIVEVPNE